MDACDYDKRTALHIAVSDNQEHVVKFLLGECNQQGIAKNGGDRYVYFFTIYLCIVNLHTLWN